MRLLERLKLWARALRRDVIVLWLAARHRDVPLGAKLIAAAVAAYALSPIDLIPDFIPVLGMLDDLLIVPLGIWLALRLIPPELVAQLREEAGSNRPPRSLMGAVAVGLVWLLCLIGVAALYLRY